MTILVAVKCEDGIVVGADGAATSAAGLQPVIKMTYPDKLIAIGGRVLVATTGSVGLAQRFNRHVEEAYKNKQFQKNVADTSRALSQVACRDFDSTGTPRTMQTGFGIAAIVAAEFGDDIHLVEYGLIDFQPEQKSGALNFVSMGSGQTLADPFLAFINRVLWKQKAPKLNAGLLGVYWALSHTCEFAHGLVGHPIKIGVIKRTGGKWNATIIQDDELGQLAQHVSALEERIGVDPDELFASATSSIPPAAP